jgi:drug/metabolite transporter (DMT)-like permease
MRTAVSALIMTAVLAPIDPGRLRVGRRHLVGLALLGIVMAVSSYAYYFALQRVPVATAALLIYTAPLIVLAAGVLFFGEPVRRDDVVAAVVTLLGAALVVRVYQPGALRVSAVGVGASVLSALAFAFYSLWGTRAAPGLSPWTVMVYSFTAAAVFWLPVAPPWTIPLAPHPPAVWAGLAVVVVFGTLLPFSLYLVGLRHISAAHASVTSTLEPAVAAAVAYGVLGERLEPLQIAGGALILAGIGLLHARRA